MKAERNIAANTLRGTLLPRMATLGASQTNGVVIPLKAPCLHLRKIGTSIVKKRKERAFSLPGKLPAPYNSRDFSLRFGSGSPLPLNQCLYWLSMAVSFPSLPLNLLTGDKLRTVGKQTARIPPRRCRLAVCSRFVQLVIIEFFLSKCAAFESARSACIKQDHRSCQALCLK
jgi:hypothetical protein